MNDFDDDAADELTLHYRRASAADSSRPSQQTRAAISAQARKVMAYRTTRAADEAALAQMEASPAANDSRWRLRAVAGLAAVGLAGLLAMQAIRNTPGPDLPRATIVAPLTVQAPQTPEPVQAPFREEREVAASPGPLVSGGAMNSVQSAEKSVGADAVSPAAFPGNAMGTARPAASTSPAAGAPAPVAADSRAVPAANASTPRRLEQKLASAPTEDAPAFEIVTLATGDQRTDRHVMHLQRTRQARATLMTPNVTLKTLVGLAYDVQDSQVIGGPDWADKSTFGITLAMDQSVLSGALAGEPKVRLMLRKVLADRFGLELHREFRPLRAAALVVSEQGAKIRLSETRPGEWTGLKFAPHQLLGRGAPIRRLANDLFMLTGTTIVDMTKLDQTYDFAAQWSTDPGRPNFNWTTSWTGDGPGRTVWPGAPAPPNVSLEAALERQLGLTLQPGIFDVEVLVIDAANQPVTN